MSTRQRKKKTKGTHALNLLLDLPLLPPLGDIVRHPLKVVPHEDGHDDGHDRKGDDPETMR